MVVLRAPQQAAPFLEESLKRALVVFDSLAGGMGPASMFQALGFNQPPAAQAPQLRCDVFRAVRLVLALLRAAVQGTYERDGKAAWIGASCSNVCAPYLPRVLPGLLQLVQAIHWLPSPQSTISQELLAALQDSSPIPEDEGSMWCSGGGDLSPMGARRWCSAIRCVILERSL